MNLVLARCPIVLAGSWNVAIFASIPWVQNNLFGGKTVQGQMKIGPEGASTEFWDELVRLSVLPTQVQVLPGAPTLRAFESAEKLACDLLSILTHTPLQGVGVNIGIDISDMCETLSRSLTVSDNENLTDLGISVNSVAVARALALDGRTVNFQVGRVGQGAVMIDINNHHNTSTGPEAIAILKGHVVEYVKKSVSLIQSLYGLTLNLEADV